MPRRFVKQRREDRHVYKSSDLHEGGGEGRESENHNLREEIIGRLGLILGRQRRYCFKCIWKLPDDGGNTG